MTWTLVKVVTTGAGTVLTNPDGTVRSLNPTTPTGGPYHWETRPAGTDGPYELCTPGNGSVCYNPVGEPVVYLFKDKVPNAGGFSALKLEPIE